MGDAISALLADDAGRTALAARAYARGRTMTWARVAEQAAVILGEMEKRSPRRLGKASAGATPLIPDLAAVLRMSDSTGMYQHGVYSVPDRHHGYCVDDNARALILMSRMDGVDEALQDHWMTVYAAFVQHAWNPERGRFRNFMSCAGDLARGGAGRRTARAARSGRSASPSPKRATRHCAPGRSPCSMRRRRICAHFARREDAWPSASSAPPRCSIGTRTIGARRRWRGPLPTRLAGLAAAASRPGWAWFERRLAYDNARLPEALLRAGAALGRDDFTACGLSTLRWLAARQIAPEGHFRPVGSDRRRA